MLSVPTLWVVFMFNFVALGIVWSYVQRHYPNFTAARYWTASTLTAAAGSGVGLLRGVIDARAPLLLGALLMILACCLAEMGVRRFYDRDVSWHRTGLIVAASMTGFAFFTLVMPDIEMRIVVYSLGQAVPTALTLRLLLSRQARAHPGAYLAGCISILMIAVYALRSVAALLHIGGPTNLVEFNPLQAGLVLLLVFLAMTWNFGFLLMAIDRLRAEVADLALLDDLTGVANRRHLLRKLAEECALVRRTNAPFVLLAIDLDGFKEINDGFGHAAGDACLQHFTLMAQSQLRPGDLLARTGGDEFCVVLPATTLEEGAAIARRLLEACRRDAAGCVGADIPVAASIGVAQWSPMVGNAPERLIAAADQALYVAKHEGKNCFSVHEAAPSLAPEIDVALQMRSTA
jgi:diguanylate cyclase (GGDEF)-like protein